MDLDDDLKVETPSPGAGADTGDVTVAPETVHATATAFSPRVATHSHYPDGTEEIVIGLLALDAIRAPGYAHDAVVAAFISDHREWTAHLGDRAIWLVGPTADLTRQLC
jgi:hypothetical protein